MMFLQVMRTKFDQFGGRAGRREFWLFWLVHFILLVIASVADALIFPDWERIVFGPILWIYVAATFVPVLALGARRLHDTGHSGWYQLLVVFWPLAVPFGLLLVFGFLDDYTASNSFFALALVFLFPYLAGALMVFVFAILPGDESDNQYGQPGTSPDRPAVYWTVLTTRYVAFAGRAGRKEYWLYTLVGVLTVGIAAFLDQWLFPDLTVGIAAFLDQWLFPDLFGDDSSNGPVLAILVLATILPGLSLGARRLHDIGRSGWWLLLYIPPVVIVGWIVILIFAIQPSQEGENKYGEPAMAPE